MTSPLLSMTAALVLALPAPLGAAEPAEVRVAVVVGNNAGLADDEPLRYAEDDARRVYDVLTRIGGVSPDRAYLLLDQPARSLRRTLAVVTGRIQELANQAPVSLVLYVSSHADRNALHLSGSRFGYDELRQSLSVMATRFRLVIVDGCQTAVRVQQKGGVPTRPIDVDLMATPQTEGEVFISSASDGEPAQEWAYLRGALFTHHLLSGLRGAADYDDNGVVSLFEAYSYTYRNTTAEAARASRLPQTPSYEFQFRGFGDWPFAQPHKYGATIELSKELSGRYWIADRANRLTSEVRKESGYVLRVHAKPGWYRVVSPRGSFVEATDVDLTWGGARRLSPDDFVRRPNQRHTLRGSEPIVLRPLQVLGGAGVAGGTVSGLDLMPSLALGLRYGRHPWFVWMRFFGSQGDFQTTHLDVSHRELRVAAAAGFTRFLFGGIEGAVGLEVEIGWVRQTSTRRAPDAGALPSGLAEGVNDGLLLSAGPVVALAVPLDERWLLQIDGVVGVSWLPIDGDSLDPRALARLTMAVGWRF